MKRSVRSFAPRSLLAAALLTAVLTAAAARPWGLGALAWLAYLPLFAALRASGSLLMSAALGAVAALGVSSVAYEAAAGLGTAFYPAVAVLATAPFALASAGAYSLQKRVAPALAWCAAPLLWALAELLPAQPALLGRFALPLSQIGYSQAELPALHLARLSSVTAVSIAILLTNALLFELIRSLLAAFKDRERRPEHEQNGVAAQPVRRLRPWPTLPRGVWASSLGLVVVALTVWTTWSTSPTPLGAGAERLGFSSPTTEAPPNQAAAVHVTLVQPHQPTALLAAANVLPSSHDEVLQHLVSLRSGQGARAEVVIWPEAAWPGRLLHDANGVQIDSTALELLSAHPPLLFGAASIGAGGEPSNAAFAWSGTDLRHVYDKVHLVPIGEGGLRPGNGFGLAHLARVLVAPLICYDVVFPELARSAALAGAELLAVLTDDAFAALGDVPLQHLRVAIFRAVETGLPLAFAANTGPSAIIDRNGAVLAQAAAGRALVLSATLGIATGSTPYLRYGNWVGALASVLIVAMSALSAARVARTTGGVGS